MWGCERRYEGLTTLRERSYRRNEKLCYRISNKKVISIGWPLEAAFDPTSPNPILPVFASLAMSLYGS